jgi:hypothetical protein
MSNVNKTTAEGVTPGDGNWLASPHHQAWMTDQAVRLLSFFTASFDAGGRFVELEDDGTRFPWAPRRRRPHGRTCSR